MPDFNDKYVYTQKKSGTSDSEFRRQIVEQAYKDFEKGHFQNKSEDFNRLMKQYVSEVSPDRKGIITSGLKAVAKNSQGTFDLSLLICGNNANSYFTGKLNSTTDVDYFHVDTMSQMMNHRPVIINMEMPVGADYDLTVYDENGNQVGMAVENEDGTKTLTIPCDWSNSRRFVIKVSQNGLDECVEGNYKLTFFQGEMPQEVKDALKRMQTGAAGLLNPLPYYRFRL